MMISTLNYLLTHVDNMVCDSILEVHLKGLLKGTIERIKGVLEELEKEK